MNLSTVYPTVAVAKMLGLTPRRIQMLKAELNISPVRISNLDVYSQEQVELMMSRNKIGRPRKVTA